jgi:hypothetical protein
VKPNIGKNYQWDDLSGTGPGIWLLEKAKSREDLRDISRVGGYFVNLEAYYKAAQDFRRLMHERNRMREKPELRISIPYVDPRE